MSTYVPCVGSVRLDVFDCYREFTMAEIEHFCDPVDKSHPKFVDVADVNVVLYSACNQMDGMPPERLTIGEAVRTVGCTVILQSVAILDYFGNIKLRSIVHGMFLL